MMLTAAEAKKLYDESGHEVQTFLDIAVEPLVTAAAKKGQRSCHIHIDTIETFENLSTKITPLQYGVLKKLEELGYRSSISLKGLPYVPRGLADDYGDGPKHTNYGFNIHW